MEDKNSAVYRMRNWSAYDNGILIFLLSMGYNVHEIHQRWMPHRTIKSVMAKRTQLVPVGKIRWPKHLEAIAAREWLAGKSFRNIAKRPEFVEAGISHAGVTGKLNRLGLIPRPSTMREAA